MINAYRIITDYTSTIYIHIKWVLLTPLKRSFVKDQACYLCRSLSRENELFPQTQLTIRSFTKLHTTAKREIGMQK